MILEATVHSLSYTQLTRPLSTSSFSVSPSSFFHTKTSLPAATSHSNFGFRRSLPKQLKCVGIKGSKLWKVGIVHASEVKSQLPADDAERWLLEPVGDGDCKHIGFQVPMPGAYEIVSDVMIVGRDPEKADIIIPVATVSGLHARLRKEGGALYITDLESTNGTFINNQRLRPGASVSAPPGSRVTFGDIHLAMFRVTKLDKVKEEPKQKEVAEGSAETAEATRS
ncbi:hypothetical protein Ancab_011392 [Ancistrocladus abbreviatus]